VRPRILDLFCKAGGCSVGYHRAGFEVEGVDIEPQPNYPFKFTQMDWLEYLETNDLSRFDAIHASPPCHRYSKLNAINKKDHYPDLVEPVRNKLLEIGKPFIIENVVGAPLRDPIMLCGTMFGLKVFRHRLFESNVFMFEPPHPKHDGSTGTHRWPYVPINGYLQISGEGNYKFEDGCKAMGIDWMKTKEELNNAIPPAYTEWIGQQLKQYLKIAV
jgi:DNA (cytosine-5)-methyltransferase 1